jgi:6-phospho-beta-glucosidase
MYVPNLPMVGVCNAPITAKMQFIKNLEKKFGKNIPPESCELNTLGLNHLSWHRGFTLDGKEIWDEVLEEYINELQFNPKPEFPPELIETLRMIPNYYLQYYYDTKHKLLDQANWPPSRAEEVIMLEKDLLKEYADPELSDPPEDLMKRGGAYYSTVATQLLNAHFNNLGEIHVVNTRQGGAVPGWPEDWVLEMPCRVDQQGVHPIPAKPLPDVCLGLITQIKYYEILTSQAAVTGDRDILFQAMLAHPLGPSMSEIKPVMEDLLKINKFYLPQFWK